MNTLLPSVRAQVLEAAQRGSHPRRLGRLTMWLRAVRIESRSRRAPLIACAFGLLGVASAFGAGVIQFGSPAPVPFRALNNAHEGFGALVPGSVRLVPIAASDPAGGLDWGMRELSTTRGEGCLEVGRLLDGKLGALGQDHAFSGDGRFHELRPGTVDINTCADLDGKGRLFTNVVAADRPASAWIGEGNRFGGCVPSTAGPYEKGLRRSARERAMGLGVNPICPQGDLRNIYYGLLGPQAKSITYVLGGERHTLSTVGRDGAYLFVTRASPHQLLNSADGGTADIVPVDGPIREIHYRTGATCHLTKKSWTGGAYACTPSLSEPVGYVPFARAPTTAEVAAPVHVHLTHLPGGKITVAVSFTARLPVTNAHRVYVVRWYESWAPPQIYSGAGTNSNVKAGQKITLTLARALRPPRPGVIHGTVSVLQAVGAGGLEGPGSARVPVGSFSIRVP